jgi:hypothetical protein
MLRNLILGISFGLATGVAFADDAAEPVSATPSPAAQTGQQDGAAKPQPGTQQETAKSEGDVKMSGMSVLGNEEAPKSLVIVPWKSSQLGDMPALSKLLDDSTQPVDKEVFMRELAYYQIKVDSK